VALTNVASAVVAVAVVPKLKGPISLVDIVFEHILLYPHDGIVVDAVDDHDDYSSQQDCCQVLSLPPNVATPND